MDRVLKKIWVRVGYRVLVGPCLLSICDIDDVEAEDNGDWQTKGEKQFGAKHIGNWCLCSKLLCPLHMGVSGTPPWGMEDSVACLGHSGASASVRL